MKVRLSPMNTLITSFLSPLPPPTLLRFHIEFLAITVRVKMRFHASPSSCETRIKILPPFSLLSPYLHRFLPLTKTNESLSTILYTLSSLRSGFTRKNTSRAVCCPAFPNSRRETKDPDIVAQRKRHARNNKELTKVHLRRTSVEGIGQAIRGGERSMQIDWSAS